MEISTDGGTTYTPLPVETYREVVFHVPTFQAVLMVYALMKILMPSGVQALKYRTMQPGGNSGTFDLSNYLTTNVRIRFRMIPMEAY